MKHLDGNPIPLAILMLCLGPTYLWWPQVSGPALFCGLPILLLMLAVESRNNSRRLDQLDQASSQHGPPPAPDAVERSKPPGMREAS